MQAHGVRPARPHTGLTADGRRIAEVLTYTRRGSRMSARQEDAWAAHAPEWWIPDEAVDRPGFEVAECFERQAPLIIEIGSGVGEATAALAVRRPDANILAFEVWHPGIADTFLRLERSSVQNVRVMSVDAVWSIQHLLGPDSISELWSFFPDPWPKKRHHRRRLVNQPFAAMAAARLQPGARWRLATDWPHYAEQMQDVLDAEPALENVHGGAAPRWDDRPLTRFERRGIHAGRPIVDLTYRRRG